MLLIPLLFAAAIADAHWPVVLACPTVSVPGTASGSGVVIGVSDGSAYLLTAAHVVGKSDVVELVFSSRTNFPRPFWYPEKARVVARWPDADLALVQFPVTNGKVPVLQLAPAWQRPKIFPAAARSIAMDKVPARIARSESIRGREFVARDRKQPAFFWMTETPPEHGRSGGPLLDQRGRVIGIAVAAAGGCGFYAHHDEILAALKRHGFGWLIPNK